MKGKFVLLVLAAVGATALAASAQQPATSTYVFRSTQSPDVLVSTPVPPQPPAPPPGSQVQNPPDDVPAPPQPPAPPMGSSSVTFDGAFHPYTARFVPFEHDVAQQAGQLAKQLAAAKSDSEREKVKSQLTDLLGKQFDQRQKRHEDEIKQLEAQIKKLKDLVDKRQKNRGEIIASRLNQIVKESQGLGW